MSDELIELAGVSEAAKLRFEAALNALTNVMTAALPTEPDDDPFADVFDTGPTLTDLSERRLWHPWCLEMKAGKDGRERLTKVPYGINGESGSSTDPTKWGTRAEAEAAARKLLKDGREGGVGIVLGHPMDHECCIGGIDLDTCRDTAGNLTPWAAAVVAMFGTYTEVSLSGTGVKTLFVYRIADRPRLLAALKKDGVERYGRAFKRRGDGGAHPPSTELYLGKRFFAVTDQPLPGSPAELATVPIETLLKLINITGPAFAAGKVIGRRVSDQSRSGRALALAGKMHRAGGTKEEFEEALIDDDLGEGLAGWADDQRQVDRAWAEATRGTPAELTGYALTEDGIALAFAARHADTLKYDHDAGCWYQWDGTRWAVDGTQMAFNWCRTLCRDVVNADKLSSAAKTFSKASTMSAVEKLARSDPSLAVKSEQWDQNDWLLGTPGGVVDLKTCELRDARHGDYITKSAAIAPLPLIGFDPLIHCPRWVRFLDEATKGDAGLIRFLGQWAGYSMTGITIEQALLFIYGEGGNGKGIFIDTVSGVLGDYATTAPMETFSASSFDRHPTELARLRGARLVTAQETEEGRAWAANRIKELTGAGDGKIAARFMRQDFFEYRPQFKLTFIGNHKPVLHTVDEAIRRRFTLALFEHKPKRKDRNLMSKLKVEWPAILTWMIRGCLDWQRNGLVKPESVTKATDAYFEDQDTFGQWLAGCCEPGPNYAALTGDLWDSWECFAHARGENKHGKSKGFPDALAARGFIPIRDTLGLRGRGYKGLRLRAVTTRRSGFDDDDSL